MKDFFISYNKADRDVAVWIAQVLQESNYSTIVQAEDMLPGSNFVLEMDRAVKQTRRTIAVLSPDYLTSLYTQPEWAAAFRNDPTGEKGLLIPVRVRACQPEGLLAQIVYLDFVGQDGEAAKEALLAGLKRQANLPPRFPVDALVEKYLAHLAPRVNTIRIFGNPKLHQLDQVFVELTISEEYERRPNQAEFLGLMDTELRRMRSVFGDAEQDRDRDRAEDPDRRAPTKTKRTLKPDELLRRHTHAVITGAPGCGKTTLLRYLAWQTLKQWKAHGVPPSGGLVSSQPAATEIYSPPEGGTPNARFPVFLELKQLTARAFQQAQGRLEDLLFAQAIAAMIKPRDDAERDALKQRFLDLLRAGRVAVFLDGLDEVSGASFFRDLQTAVSEFLHSAYSGNTVIISTRPFALRQLGDAQAMEILPLNPRQIEQFIAHYYGDLPESQSFRRELQRRRELRELARMPALLGFILQLWRKHGSVTGDKLQLYEQITLELARQLDREKVGNEPARAFKTPDDERGTLKLEFLRHLAFAGLFKGITDLRERVPQEAERLVFSSDTILTEARRFISTWVGAGQSQPLDPLHLAADAKATAMLRQVGTDHYAFAHLTLQEYLAATQLARHDAATCERFFCRAYFNLTLAEMEVLPMTLGLVDEPDKLYEALEQLPESLDFKGLRLSVRGFAYEASLSKALLEKLTTRLIAFISSFEDEKYIYKDFVSRSVSNSTGDAQKLILELTSTLLLSKTAFSERDGAAEILGNIGTDQAIATLVSALDDNSPNVRTKVVESLGQAGGSQAMCALSTAMSDDVSVVRMKAVVALRQIGGEDAITALIRGLKVEYRDVRALVIVTLGEIGGKRAIPPLATFLQDQSDHLRMAAVKALGRIGGDQAAEVLTGALKSQYRDVRWGAVAALGQIGGEGTVAVLLEVLNSEHPDVRANAALALGNIGSEKAVPFLIVALKSEYNSVRRSAAFALGMLRAEASVDALIETSQDKDVEVRERTVWALGQIKRGRAIDALFKALQDESIYVRFRAAESLGANSGEGALNAIIGALKTIEAHIRLSAVAALEQMGGDKVIDPLLIALQDQDTEVCKRAIRALRSVGGERGLMALMRALNATHSETRSKAAEELIKLDRQLLVKMLLAAMSQEDVALKRKALRIVGYYASDERIHQKIDIMTTDPSEEIRQAAREALQKFERKLQYFDIPIPTTTTNDPSPPSPPPPKPAEESGDER